jgi:hypothetical protein
MDASTARCRHRRRTVHRRRRTGPVLQVQREALNLIAEFADLFCEDIVT